MAIYEPIFDNRLNYSKMEKETKSVKTKTVADRKKELIKAIKACNADNLHKSRILKIIEDVYSEE